MTNRKLFERGRTRRRYTKTKNKARSKIISKWPGARLVNCQVELKMRPARQTSVFPWGGGGGGREVAELFFIPMRLIDESCRLEEEKSLTIKATSNII